MSTPAGRARRAAGRGSPGRWRHHRTRLLVGSVLVLAVALAVILSGPAATTTALDPDNPGPTGARAVARVLADRGVDVSVARGADALAEADPGPGTTVVVTSTDNLGRSTTERLLRDTAGARVVLVEPGPGVAGLLDAPRPAAVGLGGGRAAGCDDPLLAGLTLEVDRALAYPGGDCFHGAEGALLTEHAGVVLFGAGQALTNDQVLRADNAAVVIRLLGADERLVWYVASVDDLVGDEGVALTSLLPPWIVPGLWLVAVAAIALVWWRGRRLGPLAVEPLPVVVRAIETTRSRGRLYRRSGDRGHAAQALRRAARDRARERLRVGRSPDEVLVREVARHVGRPEAEVAELLGPGSPPPTDTALVDLAAALTELDREVRRR